MTARDAAAKATQQRILEAALELFTTRDYDNITLEDIANQAKVTIPTLFRKFGSKEKLIEATAQHAREIVLQQRYAATPGDVRGAVENLLDHYELWGDRILRLLAQEGRVPAIRTVTNHGRVLHHKWVEITFAPLLPSERPARARRIAQLVAICDVYTWKILRQDLGLTRKETARAILELITAL
ncbi:TetR/AcrR family transcriptional regulator [Meiothermus sp.]|uniref:TetR/AcrR family transcriptional regulator n=1 Tax=Meiothermus sp. TaxID=1955249 RepID=UPI00263421F7|nr:TetR/AcrR family transcriptional regulator [Meiothermus sp.]